MSWRKEELDYSIKETGVRHSYGSTKKSYIAFAYPTELGELKHIYQNDLYAFDVINSFEKKMVNKDGRQFYLYVFVDKISAGVDVFEFLWKDR